MENQRRRYSDKVFDALPGYLTVQDRNFRIVAANESFRSDFGDYQGRFCYQVYKQRPEPCEDCPVARTFHDGQKHRSEELVRTLDGRAVSVLVYTTPILGENGEVAEVIEMSTDVTELKNLQKQLRDSQRKYRQLFEDVPCFISIQDRELNIVDANRLHRETFGVGYGRKCYDVYKHRTKECVPCTVQQTFRDGLTHSHEEVVTSQTGETINVLVHTAPVRGENGEIENVIEMSADITQLRQLQDKLASVGMLIGTISHGIKGLLNSLDGGIYLINSGLKKDDRARIDKGWDIALRNVERIRSMVMDILYYAKDREPNWETITGSDLAKDVCNLMVERAKKMQIDLECAMSGDGRFECDPQMIRSLLVNLVENALDACRIDAEKPSHQVKVELREQPEAVQLVVTDNGIGMDRETREKAFSLFFSSKGAGGTGLGLFISNKIAQAHGGRILVESEEGKGSSFLVELPRRRPHIAPTDANVT
ncbi:MAG: PAS domain-containing sensor histidine kinase [Candidatus Zixiibacteriota bacterium]